MLVLSTVAGWGAEAPALVFPQIVGGSGFTTEIVLTNPGHSPVVGVLRFYKPDGQEESFSVDGAPHSEVAVSIAPGGAGLMLIDDTGPVKSGWVVVTAESGGADLTGSLIYRYQGSEVSVAGATLGTGYHVFVQRSATARTAVAIVNPGASEVSLTGEVRDTESALVVSGRIVVGANQQTARFVDELFPELPSPFLGSIHLVSAGPVFGAMGLRQRSDGVLAALGGSGKAYEEGDLFAVDPIVGRLMKVPAGTFTQGSPSNEPCREYWESGSEAQFSHTLTHNLVVMQTEVTQQMWADLRAARGSAFDLENPSWVTSSADLPVDSVTWYEAVLFANELSAARGLMRAYYADAAYSQPITKANYQTDSAYLNWEANGYRLPTEGEWEYFARAGTTGPFSVNEPNYSSGNCGTTSCSSGALPQLESAAWFCANSGNSTHAVGQKAANPWGLKDVHGNVYEWCWDWYATSYPGENQTDYPGPSGGSFRVLRGGDWVYSAHDVRSAARGNSHPSGRHPDFGFRLVRSVN